MRMATLDKPLGRYQIKLLPTDPLKIRRPISEPERSCRGPGGPEVRRLGTCSHRGERAAQTIDQMYHLDHVWASRHPKPHRIGSSYLPAAAWCSRTGIRSAQEERDTLAVGNRAKSVSGCVGEELPGRNFRFRNGGRRPDERVGGGVVASRADRYKSAR